MATRKTVAFESYTITRDETNRIIVTKNGEVQNNAKGALREIASKCGFEADNTWTTQQFGAKLIVFLEEHKDKLPSFDHVEDSIASNESLQMIESCDSPGKSANVIDADKTNKYDTRGNLEKTENTAPSQYATRFGGGMTIHDTEDPEIALVCLSTRELPIVDNLYAFAKNIQGSSVEGLFTQFDYSTIERTEEDDESAGRKKEYDPNGYKSKYDMHYGSSEDYKNGEERVYLSGTVETHSCSKTEDCYECNGTGVCQDCDGRGYHRCRKCDGTGKVDERCGTTKDGKPKYKKVACPKCHGSGKILCSSCGGSKKCHKCGGSGQVTCQRCEGSGYYQTFRRCISEYSKHKYVFLNYGIEDDNIKIKANDLQVEDTDRITSWSEKNNFYSESKEFRSRQYVIPLASKLQDIGCKEYAKWAAETVNNMYAQEKSDFEHDKWSFELKAESYGFPVSCYKYEFEGEQYCTYIVGREPKNLYGTYPTSHFFETYQIKSGFFTKLKTGFLSGIKNVFLSEEKRKKQLRHALMLLALRAFKNSGSSTEVDAFIQKFKLEPDELNAIKAVNLDITDKEFYKEIPSNLKNSPAAIVWAYTFAGKSSYYKTIANNLEVNDSALFEKIEKTYSDNEFGALSYDNLLGLFVDKYIK